MKQITETKAIIGKTISRIYEGSFLTFQFFTDETYCVFQAEYDHFSDQPATAFFMEEEFKIKIDKYEKEMNQELIELGFVTQQDVDKELGRKEKELEKLNKEFEIEELKVLQKKYPNIK